MLNFDQKYLTRNAEFHMTMQAEEWIAKQYKISLKENLYDHLTDSIVEEIKAVIARQPDPTHWSLSGYQSIIDAYTEFQSYPTPQQFEYQTDPELRKILEQY